MTAMLGKAVKIWRNEGPSSLLRRGVQWGYDTYLRPFLPKRIDLYNGVSVRASHVGDSIVSWHTRDIPNYEDALIRGIRQYVENGDTVVVVGGGWGVSTVVAARKAGENGCVITHEGGEETVKKVEDTLELNSVTDRVSVRHAIVGEAVSLRDDGTRARAVSPADLPDCDVLVLDCEGAEVEILEKMEIRPKSIIVETHGLYGAPEADVRDKLTTADYDTVENMVAEKRLQTTCEENGIYVLFATVQN